VRPVAELRIGIDTLKEKWEAFLNQNCSYVTQDYLSSKYNTHTAELNYFINASYFPTEAFTDQLEQLNPNQMLVFENNPVVFCTEKQELPSDTTDFFIVKLKSKPIHIKTSSDLFSKNAAVLEQDFERFTQGKKSKVLEEDNNRFIHPERIFIEPGAQLSYVILNATDGPIYIEKKLRLWKVPCFEAQ
tara:strand:+ start:10611 stop:11174 length:564 start_codon:yes stop_codon:yes gene_type:complete